jgi:hypothetical protein
MHFHLWVDTQRPILFSVVDNTEKFHTKSDIRQKLDVHVPNSNLTSYQNGVYYPQNKLFNYLPPNIKMLWHDRKAFKTAQKNSLLARCHCMEEFTSAVKSYTMHASTNIFFIILCYSAICYHNTILLLGYIYINYVIIFIMTCSTSFITITHSIYEMQNKLNYILKQVQNLFHIQIKAPLDTFVTTHIGVQTTYRHWWHYYNYRRYFLYKAPAPMLNTHITT